MLLDRLRAGDTLVVWKLDRLGRSLKDLVTLVTSFQEKGILFVSLHSQLDTTTAQGRLTFNLFASLADFERDIIRKRTKTSLTAACGRPKRLSEKDISKAQAAKTLYLQQDKTVAILRLNTVLYPASANTYDSLGEILELTGDRPGALKNYRRSLALNPANANAATHIKSLEKK